MVRWSGERQVNVRWMSNLNLSLTLVDVKLVFFFAWFPYFINWPSIKCHAILISHDSFYYAPHGDFITLRTAWLMCENDPRPTFRDTFYLEERCSASVMILKPSEFLWLGICLRFDTLHGVTFFNKLSPVVHVKINGRNVLIHDTYDPSPHKIFS